MTCIVRHATKKAFREAVATDPSRVGIDDPSLFNPFDGASAADMKVGQRLTVTNHPKRSWFATIARTATGFKVS